MCSVGKPLTALWLIRKRLCEWGQHEGSAPLPAHAALRSWFSASRRASMSASGISGL